MTTQVSIKDQIQATLNKVEKYALMSAKKVLTFEEAQIYTGYSKGQLYQLTHKKQIPYSKRGKRIFFDKSLLDAWLIQNIVTTTEDIDNMASTHVMFNPIKL